MDENSYDWSYGSIGVGFDNLSSCDFIDFRNRSDEAISSFIDSTRYDLYWVYTWLFLCTVAVIGPPANCAIMVMIWRNRDMRSKMDLLIFALSFADFCLLVSWTAIVGINQLTSPLTFFYPREWRAAVCFGLMTVKDASLYAAIVIVAVISHESYLAVCRPFFLSRVLHKRRPIAGVAMPFLVAIVTAAAQIPTRYIVHRVCLAWPARPEYDAWPTSIETCLTAHPEGHLRTFAIVNWLCLSVICFILVVIIAIMDIKTYRRLGQINQDLPNASIRKIFAQRHAVARMIAVTGSVCILLLLPYWLFRSLRLLFESLNVAATALEMSLASVFWFLLCSKSLINPFVYVATNNKYRKVFLRMYIPCVNSSEDLHANDVFLLRSPGLSTHALSNTNDIGHTR